eukprot:4678210-Amphidinium_carterae.1
MPHSRVPLSITATEKFLTPLGTKTLLLVTVPEFLRGARAFRNMSCYFFARAEVNRRTAL